MVILRSFCTVGILPKIRSQSWLVEEILWVFCTQRGCLYGAFICEPPVANFCAGLLVKDSQGMPARTRQRAFNASKPAADVDRSRK